MILDLIDKHHILVGVQAETISQERVSVRHVEAQVLIVLLLRLGIFLHDVVHVRLAHLLARSRVGAGSDGHGSAGVARRGRRHRAGLFRALVQIAHAVQFGRPWGRPRTGERARRGIAAVVFLQRFSHAGEARVEVRALLASLRVVPLAGLKTVTLRLATSLEPLRNAGMRPRVGIRQL